MSVWTWLNDSSVTQLLSYQRGSMILHFTGGREIGIVGGRDVGKNSPGHRWRESTNNSPTRTPRNRGARTFERRLLLAFCGQTNTRRESPIKSAFSILFHSFTIHEKNICLLHWLFTSLSACKTANMTAQYEMYLVISNASCIHTFTDLQFNFFEVKILHRKYSKSI